MFDQRASLAVQVRVAWTCRRETCQMAHTLGVASPRAVVEVSTEGLYRELLTGRRVVIKF